MGSLRKSKHDIKNRVIKADNSFFRVRRNKLLSTQEHRLFSYALNKMQSSKDNLVKRDSTKSGIELVTTEMFNQIREVEFDLDEFLNIFNIERRSFISKIDKAILGLEDFKIILERYENKKLKSKIFYNVMSYVQYDIPTNKILIGFNYDTKDLFCNLHNSRIGFTAVNLIETFEMTSNYAVAMYEYLKSFLERKDIKKLGELSVKYEELRNILAVPETEYKQFTHFKQKVLDISKTQINANKNSVFDLDYSLKKSGRGGKVSEIIFKLTKRKIEPKIVKTESTEQASDTTHVTMTDEEQRTGLDALKKLKKMLKNPAVHPDQISMVSDD